MNLPKITIVLVTYFPDQKSYLDLCVKSLMALDYPKDKLDIVLVGRKGYAPQYPGIFTVYPDKDEHFYTAEALNYGASFVSSDSKYLMDLNDDTMLTKNSLRKMVDHAENLGGKYAINPLSNCEHGMFYDFYGLSGLDPWPPHRPQYIRMPNVAFREDEFINMDSSHRPAIMEMPYLCMFSTLIPTKAWREIKNGTTKYAIGFDTTFKVGQDDVDYSKRMLAAGYRLAICADAIVWHFGGVNSSGRVNDAMRKANVEYFRHKWKEWPPGMTDETVKAQWGIVP